MLREKLRRINQLIHPHRWISIKTYSTEKVFYDLYLFNSSGYDYDYAEDCNNNFDGRLMNELKGRHVLTVSFSNKDESDLNMEVMEFLNKINK